MMKRLMKGDHAWKCEKVLDTVKAAFPVIQAAWSNMDLSPAAQYMSEELHGSFETKLNWMAYRNERNILKRIRLLRALPVAVHDDPDNSRDCVWFYIKGRMIDYTVDTDTNAKISGSRLPSSFVEYWQFIREKDRWVLHKILQKDETDQIPFDE